MNVIDQVIDDELSIEKQRIPEECMKILLVERNKNDAEVIQEHLRQMDMPVDVQCVSELETAFKILSDNRADLIVIDLVEEPRPTIETIRRVTTEAPTVPCVALANSCDDALESKKAIKSEPFDILVKSQITAEHISRSIKYVVALSNLRKYEQIINNTVCACQDSKMLFESSADAITVFNCEGVITAANLAAEKLYGAPRTQLIGIHLSALEKKPEQLRELTDAFNKTLSDGSISDFRVSWPGRSGEAITCSFNASSYRDQNGEVAGLIASGRDITQQLRQEEELRLMASIVEHSNDAIISESLDGIVTNWNKAAETIYGYSTEEMLGNSVSCVIPTDRLDEIPELMKRLAAGECIDHFETKRLKKDGQCIDVSLSLSPVKDSSGNVVGASIISRDFTEAKRSAEKVEYSEKLFRLICEGALDAIVCMEQDGNITVWNDAAEKIFGYKSDDVIGKSVHSILAPARYYEAFSAGLANFKMTGQGPILGKMLELEAIRADGSEIPIELAVSSIQIDDTWYAVGVIRDISERRHAERLFRDNEEALLEERNSIKKVNELLSIQANDLRRYATQMELLTQLGEYLQICDTDQEANAIVAQFGAKLCPDTSGELFVFDESKNWLERVASWGDAITERKGFAISDCWSIRRGQPHSFNSSKPGPRCLHVSALVKNGLCVPLVLLGEIFGLMCVQWNTEIANPEDENLVTRLTGDAALALANLKLRKQLQDLSIRDSSDGIIQPMLHGKIL